MAENALTRKLGPLPTWVWVSVAAGLVLLYVWWQDRSGSSATSSASTQPPEVFQIGGGVTQTTPPEQSGDGKKHTKKKKPTKKSGDKDDDKDDDGISREHRSPYVRKREHQIYEHHQQVTSKSKGGDKPDATSKTPAHHHSRVTSRPAARSGATHTDTAKNASPAGRR